MSYRIDYVEREGTLKAVVSGRSSLEQAARIARDIADEASSQAARHLLIDLRRLADRVGSLGALVLPAAAVADCRVAVLDVRENDPHYAFSEHAAFKRGTALRMFCDPVAALRWLQGE
jgi:hypothetical protein